MPTTLLLVRLQLLPLYYNIYNYQKVKINICAQFNITTADILVAIMFAL